MFWKRRHGRSAPGMARLRSRGRKRGFKGFLRRSARVLRWTLRLLLLFLILDLVYLGLTWPDWHKIATGPIPKSAFMREYETQLAENKDWPRLRWQPVAFSSFPQPLLRAVILAEDSRFYEHSGFDLIAFKEAMEYNLDKGHFVFGASTISQQTVKNLFLTPSRNPLRKWHELILTWGMERQLSKRRILEIYLNVAQFGRGISSNVRKNFWPCSNAIRAMPPRRCASVPSICSCHRRITEPRRQRTTGMNRRRKVVTSHHRHRSATSCHRWKTARSGPVPSEARGVPGDGAGYNPGQTSRPSRIKTPVTFQELIFTLSRYWARQGCVMLQPYDMEMGAGTFHTATFLRALGPEPWKAAYVQPSRRPKDGRYGENPNRLQHYYQYQVVLKPAPANILELYLGSLEALGFDLKKNDIRFVEDDWESPTLGAWGLGWEVWLDGMEITQFTYFQQVGGIDLNPISVEITYGLERLALFSQKKSNIFEILWDSRRTYGEIHGRLEREFSKYHFELSDEKVLRQRFDQEEKECARLLVEDCVLPAYDSVMLASHFFNLLDARGAISVTERAAYIGRIRNLARSVAAAYLDSRARLGFPMAPKAWADEVIEQLNNKKAA